MKLSAKILVMAAIIANGLVIAIIIFRHHGRSHDLADSQLKTMVPQLHAKISGEIERLKRESVLESLKKLEDVNLYYWPGPSATANGDSGGFVEEYLPLGEEEGLSDLEAISSNRRFCKSFEQFSPMKRANASQMINEELARTIADYLKLYDAEMGRFASHYQLEKLAGQTSIVGPAFVTGNVQDGKVVVAGVRLKILALVWLCGVLELTDCKTNVENVTRIAFKQRMDMYNDTALHPFFKSEMLKRASLYNRQIIGSGLLGVAANRDASVSILKALGLQWRERNLTSYKAALTEFDPLVQSGIMKPDYSLGSKTIKFLPPIDDSRFDQLMKNCGIAP